MKYFLTTAWLLAGSALAAGQGYDLKTEVTINGKAVAAPEMIVKKGQLSTAATKDVFIEVLADENPVAAHPGILMKFTVGSIGPNGERKILGKPQIIAAENQRAEVTVSSDEKGADKYSLAVTAHRNAF